ncbi:MAG: ABC transporter substrate-binding protein, partial [bacterium]
TVILTRRREVSTRIKALLTGEADLAVSVPPHMIPMVEKNPDTVWTSVPSVRIMYVGFFTRLGGPLEDLNVRLAINYAIDAKSILDTILGGRGDLYGQMIHTWNYSGYNPKKEWHGYDLAKAKAYLKKSDYPNGFKATLITANGAWPGDKATCEAITGMLKKINIDTLCQATTITLFRKTYRVYKKKKKKGNIMYLMGFGNSAGNPGLVLLSTTACKGGWSSHCFKDLDKAMDEALSTADLKLQQARLEGVTDLMKAKATHKILFKLHDVTGIRKNVKFSPRHDELVYPWELSFK